VLPCTKKNRVNASCGAQVGQGLGLVAEDVGNPESGDELERAALLARLCSTNQHSNIRIGKGGQPTSDDSRIFERIHELAQDVVAKVLSLDSSVVYGGCASVRGRRGRQRNRLEKRKELFR
jgi:hypothetical protein